MVVMEAAQTMAEGAANALLKTLEEPGQATIILLAPGPQALLPTLVSRCQTIPFGRLGPEEMAAVLTRVGRAEVLNYPQILAMAQGSPGQAIEAYQQLEAIPPGPAGEFESPSQLAAAGPGAGPTNCQGPGYRVSAVDAGLPAQLLLESIPPGQCPLVAPSGTG